MKRTWDDIDPLIEAYRDAFDDWPPDLIDAWDLDQLYDDLNSALTTGKRIPEREPEDEKRLPLT